MKKYGLKGANVPKYSPNAISEHTVMLVLAALRNFRRQILNVERCNYQLTGVQGREIRNMVIGIVGAGRIGYVTMKCLSGFKPKKIYAYDPYQNDNVKEYAEYTTLEQIYELSDVIIFHAVYNDSNHHMVNDGTISKMKDGVILVNSSRGGLFDAQAVLRGVESGKIGGVCLDVIEGEGVLRKQQQFKECPIPTLQKLLAHDNVIYTPHSAFYTDEAERNLTQGTIDNLVSYMKTENCDNELIQR
jgi:D-lactate dehydrogenase